MGARAVSPGGALLRKSRLFSVPNVLPEPPTMNLHISDHKSATMTKAYPQYQSITSPLSSREKGDWGLKRSFPLKSTMTTSTPLIRVKAVDTIESVTDFSSAADHTLSLEKFQEMRIAMSVPRGNARSTSGTNDVLQKSVFEEDMDFTAPQPGRNHERRWKFSGPWLARLTEGDFIDYLNKTVRPKRAEFRRILKNRLAGEITARQAEAALEDGKPAPAKIEPRHISDTQFNDYLRSLRHDRITLYSLVSKFLDLAPLGQPIGIVQTIWSGRDNVLADSPYGKSGPPPSHPSAGISYLRTSSVMENHPVYGPQARKTPSLARVVYPRSGPFPAKLGVGGFIANAPAGDNEFNMRHGRDRGKGKALLNGIKHLDTTTPGGAKAYVEPLTASVDPSGKVVLQLRETHGEASLVAKESKGQAKIYDSRPMARHIPQPAPEPGHSTEEERMHRLADEILESEDSQAQVEEKEVLGSAKSYGLESLVGGKR